MSRVRLVAVVVGSSLALLLAGPAGAVGGWQVVPTPNPSAQSNYLSAAVTIAPNDVWAVGTEYQPSGSAGTLAEHWDGSAWKAVRTPNPFAGYNELFAVDAVSSTEVWAVGYTHGQQYVDEKTLIEDWDGTRWSAVPSPNLGANANVLYGVSVAGPDDIWAVGLGNSSSNVNGRAIAEHWDGTSWTLVPTAPAGSGISQLFGVEAISSTDVWAVGQRGTQALIEHWDGSSWSLVANPSLPRSELESISAVSSTDVWAVGSAAGKSLTEHWDGSTWTRFSSPNGSKPSTFLHAVKVFGPSNVWAVGYTVNDVTVVYRTVSEHWDGSTWTMVPSPNPSAEYDLLLGIDGTPGGEIWAVGEDEDTLAIRRLDA